MNGEGPGPRLIDENYLNSLRNPIGFRLTKIRKLWTTEATVGAVDDTEREFFFEKQIRFSLLKHVVDFSCARAPRDGVCDSQNADPVLLLAGL